MRRPDPGSPLPGRASRTLTVRRGRCLDAGRFGGPPVSPASPRATYMNVHLLVTGALWAAAVSAVPCPVRGRPCPVLSLLPIPRFDGVVTAKSRCSARVASGEEFRGQTEPVKNVNKNNILQSRRDHICVLFVQHSPGNALHMPVSVRSLVVCARSFGNCDRATEGIPRSSRLGHSLKSLAFMRVCPKARRSRKR